MKKLVCMFVGLFILQMFASGLALAQETVKLNASATMFDFEEDALRPLSPGYYFIDGNGVKHQLADLEVKEDDGLLGFGYFYDFKSGEVLRGFGLRLAKRDYSGLPVTVSLGGLAQSMEIGDLNGSFILSTDLKTMLEQRRWKFLFAKDIEIGPFFSFFDETMYGFFSTLRF